MFNSDDFEKDFEMVCIDKEFLYFLLSCLIAQKNINKLTFDKRDFTQEAINKAFDDGIKILKGVDFVPQCDILFRRTMAKLSNEYMEEYFGGVNGRETKK